MMPARREILLPVCGMRVSFRLPNGADDIALIEEFADPREAGLCLIARLAEGATDGPTPDWSRMPVTDFEILLLHLRTTLLGSRLFSHCLCPGCRERVEISFDVGDYIAAIRPRIPPGVAESAQPGWLMLDRAKFRVPCVADQIAVRDAAAPGAALRALCLAPGLKASVGRRIEAEIARIAPEVSGLVGGACPQCGAALQALFDVASYVVTELRRLAAGIYDEVHLLASAFGWREAEILALPGPRRRRYAERVRA